MAENKIKIIIILSRPMINKLQEYGDLHSVVKFSYFFKDHSIKKKNQDFSNGRLKRLIKQYEKYNSKGNIKSAKVYDFSFGIAVEAYNVSDFKVWLKYFEISLRNTDNNKTKKANTLGNIGGIYVDLGDFDKALEYQENALAPK